MSPVAARPIELEIASGLRFSADHCGTEEAPLVLLLHGFPQTRHAWRHELPALAAAGLRAVAPDQRGYSPGARPLGVEPYAAHCLVSDVLAMADALGARRFFLVGHDWGGQVAWLVAARHPERVRALCVLSRPHPAAFAEALTADAAQSDRSSHHRSFRDPEATDRLLEDGARRLRRALERQSVPAPDIEAYLSVLASRDALDAALNWYRAAALPAAATSGLAAREIPAVRVPTLYVWGDADATVGRAAAEATARYVDARYRFVVVPGAGHFLSDEPTASAKVTEAIVGWLRSHASARAG